MEDKVAGTVVEEANADSYMYWGWGLSCSLPDQPRCIENGKIFCVRIVELSDREIRTYSKMMSCRLLEGRDTDKEGIVAVRRTKGWRR